MQPPLSHWNWKAEQTGQFSSSLLSSHSGKPSQRQAIGIQSISPVEQVNCSVEQVGGSERQKERERGGNMWRRRGRGEKDKEGDAVRHVTLNVVKTEFQEATEIRAFSV